MTNSFHNSAAGGKTDILTAATRSIPLEVERLGGVTTRLGDVLVALSDRLGPVLMPRPPLEKEAAGPTPICELAAILSGTNDRLCAIENVLHSLTSRIEL